MAEDLNTPLENSGIESGLEDIKNRTQEGFTGLQTSFNTQIPVQAPLVKAALPEVYEDIAEKNQSNDYQAPTKALGDALNAFEMAPVVAYNATRTAATGTFGTNRYHHNVARYEATPGDTYEKLGFSPWRDNEEYYDEHMSNWNDFRRATKAFWGNIMTGIESYNPFGMYEGGDKYKDIVTADKFAENTAVYQSRRKNGSAILGNAIGQSGLGVGMALGFMAESAAITLATGGLGMIPKLAKIPLQAQKARALYKAFSFANKYKKGTHVFETTKGASTLRKLWKVGTKPVKWAAKTAMPHTAQWGKSIRTADDVTNFMKGAKFFGAAYKDYAITAMAMAESKMEAGLNYQRVEGELLEEFRKKYGKEPSLSEWDEIQRMADLSATRVFQWNYPLIAATNFLVFGTLFRGMSKPVFGSLGQTIGRNSAGKTVFTKGAGAQVVGRLGGVKSIYGRAKTGIMTPKAWGKNIKHLGRGVATYTGANVGEGIQETLQEVVSDTGSDYYKSVYWNKKGDPSIGNWMQMAYGNTVKYATSWEGFEIFASGFLMGGIMGSGTKAGTYIGQKFVQKGVAGKAYKEKFIKYQAAKKEELQKIADGFNAVHKNPLLYFDENLENFAIQKQIQEDIKEAEEMENKKGSLDSREDAFTEHISAAYNSGRIDIIEDTISDMRNLDVEAFNKANLTKFTTQDEVNKSVDGMLARVKEIGKTYNEVNERYTNPHNPWRHKADSVEFATEAYLSLAHKRFVKDMVFNRTKLNNAIKRNAELYNKLKKAPWWKFKGTAESVVGAKNLEPLLNPYVMQEELRLLTFEIAELETRDGQKALTPEQKKELKDKAGIRDTYRKFNDAQERYRMAIGVYTPQYDSETNESGIYSEEEIAEQQEALDLFHKAWEDVINELTNQKKGFVSKQDIDDAFVGIKDMAELDADANKYSENANYLLSPEVYADHVRRGREFYERTHSEAREFLEKNVKAHFEAQENSGLHQILHAEGFLLTAEGYDTLFEDGEMPTANQIIEVGEGNEGRGKALEEDSPRYQEVTEIITAFLAEVPKDVSIKEYSEDLAKQIDKERAKQALAEAEPIAPTELTMLDEGGNSNYENWADVPGLQEEVQKVFAEKQAEREKNKALEPFPSIDDWIKSRPDALSLILKTYNTQREAEYKTALEVYQQKQKEAKEALKKDVEDGGKPASKVEVKKADIEKRKSILLKKADLSKAPEFAQKAIAKTVESINEKVRLQVIERAYEGITATPISKELGLTTEQVRSIRTYYGVPDIADKTEYQNWKKNIDAELAALGKPAQPTSGAVVIPPAPKVEVVPGVPAAVERVLNIIQEKQNNARQFGDLTAEEKKEHGVTEGEHGYIVKDEDGTWIKVPSVTQTIGSTFQTSVGNDVRLVATNEVGEVIEDPDENPDRLTDKEETDTFLVKLTKSGKTVEVTSKDFDNITFNWSTISGTLTDEITRDFFGPKGVSETAPDGITKKAYKQIIEALEKQKEAFDAEGLIPISGVMVDGKFKDIILYDLNAKGGPIVGAIDLLLYNPTTGKFYIYDMKTSNKTFWAVDPKDAGKHVLKGQKKEAARLSDSFDTALHEDRHGIERTKRHGYELQQSLYKNMFESMTGAPVGEQDTDGIFLLPFHTKVNKTKGSKNYAQITSIKAESPIQLIYRDEVEQWVVKPKTKPLTITEGEGGVQQVFPEALSGKGTELGEIPELKDFKFDAIHGESVLLRLKATTLRNPQAIPEWIKTIGKEAHINIKGERFLLTSLGQLTVVEAAEIINQIAEADLNNITVHEEAGLPGLPSGISMSRETAEKILAAESPGLKMAISENLPTTLPESWGKERKKGIAGQYTDGGVTYYSKFTGTGKWLHGKGKMFVFTLKADPIQDIEDIDLDVSATAKFTAPLYAIDNADDLKKLEDEISEWAVNLGSKVQDLKLLNTMVAVKKVALAEDLTTRYSGLKVGDLITVKSDEIDNFAEVIKVTMINPERKYVVVENADNNNKSMKTETISKAQFDAVVESVNAEGSKKAPVDKSDIDATEENVEKAIMLTPEAKKKAVEAAKKKGIEDLFDDSNNKIDC